MGLGVGPYVGPTPNCCKAFKAPCKYLVLSIYGYEKIGQNVLRSCCVGQHKRDDTQI